MLRRITLDNFMSHAHTVIDLAGGLTVLIGPNNCGKSAVVEALRTICFNTPSEALVRHGQKEARITIETDDGHSIVWRRKGPTVSYIIDGQERHRLGRDVPEEVLEHIRMPQVDAGEKKVAIHFADQKRPIFELLNDQSLAAAFFSSSSDAEKLMDMQRLHRQKVSNARQRQKDLAAEIEALDRQLTTLAPLDDLDQRTQAAEAEHRAILEQKTQVESLERIISAMIEVDQQRGILQQHLRVLSGLRAAPALEDETALDRLSRAIETTRTVCEREQARAAALISLSQPPQLADDVALAALVDSMRKTAGRVSLCEKGAAVLGKLANPPELQDPAALESLLASWKTNRNAAAAYAVNIVDLGREMADVESQLRRWAEKHPTCPTCGSPIDPDRILSMGHAHAEVADA